MLALADWSPISPSLQHPCHFYPKIPAGVLSGIVSGIAVAPSHRARDFVNSFDGQVDTRKLHWIDDDLRSQIYARTSEFGLISNGCAFYRAELQPMSKADIFGMRRRVRLLHHGSWDFVATGDRASDTAMMVQYFSGDLSIDVEVGPFTTGVRR
jgi:hypothetical protein